MPTTTHTDSKPKRYKTLILIIGVLVALVVGMSLSASAFSLADVIPHELPADQLGKTSFLKAGSALVKSWVSL